MQNTSLPSNPSSFSTEPVTLWSLLPARAGSQRLPNKALKPLSGLPLAHYTLDCMAALKKADATQRNWVYTNDSKLLQYVSAFNETEPLIELPPFVRPEAVSHANAGAWATVQQFLRQLQQSQTVARQEWASHLILLQATSPFRQAEQVKQAITHYQTHLETYQLNPHTTGLMSVTALEKPGSWLLGMAAPDAKTMQRLYPLDVKLPERMVRPNGAIYIVPIARLLAAEPFKLWEQLETVLPFEMPWLNSVDIDTAEEFAIAEQLFPLLECLYIGKRRMPRG
jgi:CMP-N,N'-diacetyllegionaminic acid synthase